MEEVKGSWQGSRPGFLAGKPQMWPSSASSTTTTTSRAENVLSGQEVPLLAHTTSVAEVLQVRLSRGGTGTRNKSLEESQKRLALRRNETTAVPMTAP